MSRTTPEVQRRSHISSESTVSTAPDVQVFPLRMERLAWEFWIVRGFLVACTVVLCYTLGPFGLRGAPAAGVGLLIAALILLAESRLRRVALGGLLGGALGTLLGIATALLVTLVISRTSQPEPTKSFLEYVTLFAFGYLGMVLGSERGREVNVNPLGGMSVGSSTAPVEAMKLLDTSVLIDGRIADICEAQFLDGVLGVPRFVLHELQLVADSSDPLKRQRGRRGLEVLQRMQKMPQVEVRVLEDDFPQAGDVDHKLVELARRTSAKIVTNDFNLNKVATVQGLSVLNVNQLANALKPAVLPGEPMRVLILREGKEPNQGVAYLDDGTMVVVDGARKLVNRSVDITVTSVHQTTAGKMIFGRLDEKPEATSHTMRHAAAAGTGRGDGNVRLDSSVRLPDAASTDRPPRQIYPETEAD